MNPSQTRVLDVLRELAERHTGFGHDKAELHNLGVAERAKLSPGWTSEVLRSLEKAGKARSRFAKSASDAATRWRLWRLA